MSQNNFREILEITNEGNVDILNICLKPVDQSILYHQPLPSQQPGFFSFEHFETTSHGGNEYIPELIQPILKIKHGRMRKPRNIVSKLHKIFEDLDLSQESAICKDGMVICHNRRIQEMPKHILIQIFKYLDKKCQTAVLPRVCRSWYKLSKDPSLWLELSFKGNTLPYDEICRILTFCEHLETIRLEDIPHISHILRFLCRYCNKLKNVFVRKCHLKPSSTGFLFHTFLMASPLLETLDLTGTVFDSKQMINDLALIPLLRSLDISGSCLTGHELVSISINCRKLKEFKYTPRLAPENMEARFRDGLINIFFDNLKNRLTSLEIDVHDLGTTVIFGILKCQKLVHLALINVWFLRGPLFLKIKSLKDLKSLKITKAIELTSADMIEYFSYNSRQQLTSLDVTDCWNMQDDVIKVIAKNQPSLQHLTLANCKSLTEKCVLYLSYFTHLNYLNLEDVKIEPKLVDELQTNLIARQHCGDCKKQNLKIVSNI